MSELLEQQNKLQQQANAMLASSSLLVYLEKLGDVTQTGSSATGLMVYPDVDFAIQNNKPNIHDAINLVPVIFEELSAKAIKIADFSSDTTENASYYIGFDFPYDGMKWHIDATVTRPGPIITNPPELDSWINNMSKSERETILALKKELVNSRRYADAMSQPPYTFRSSHLYEGVLKGGAKTITELEAYFSK